MLTIHGGGTSAANALNNPFAATDSDGVAFYTKCAQGDTNACDQFTSSMGSGATAALNSFNEQVDAANGASNPNLSFLALFPNGGAGADTTQRATDPFPLDNNPVLAPYAQELTTYVSVLKQIATFKNRVTQIRGLISQGPYNPVGTLNLDAYLVELEQIYGSDRSVMSGHLGNCLQARPTSRRSARRSSTTRRLMPSGG